MDRAGGSGLSLRALALFRLLLDLGCGRRLLTLAQALRRLNGCNGLLSASLVSGSRILLFLAVLCSLRGGLLRFFFLVLDSNRVSLRRHHVPLDLLTLFLFASLTSLSSQLLGVGWLLLVLLGVLSVLSRVAPRGSGLAGSLGRSRLCGHNRSHIFVFLLLFGALLA